MEPVCRSEVFYVNSLLITMVPGNSRCYQSATAVSGRDLHPAANATYNPVLLRQTGQSENGARHVSFSFFSKANSGADHLVRKLFGVVPLTIQLSAAIGSWLAFRALNLRRRKNCPPITQHSSFSLNSFLIHIIPLTFFNFCASVFRDMSKRSQAENRDLCGHQKYLRK